MAPNQNTSVDHTALTDRHPVWLVAVLWTRGCPLVSLSLYVKVVYQAAPLEQFQTSPLLSWSHTDLAGPQEAFPALPCPPHQARGFRGDALNGLLLPVPPGRNNCWNWSTWHQTTGQQPIRAPECVTQVVGAQVQWQVPTCVCVVFSDTDLCWNQGSIYEAIRGSLCLSAHPWVCGVQKAYSFCLCSPLFCSGKQPGGGGLFLPCCRSPPPREHTSSLLQSLLRPQAAILVVCYSRKWTKLIFLPSDNTNNKHLSSAY